MAHRDMEAALRQVLSCCCLSANTTQAQGQQLTYDHPRLEELHTNRSLPVPAPPGTQKWPGYMSSPAMSAGSLAHPAEVSSARSSRRSSREWETPATLTRSRSGPLSPEEQKHEKERLQDMVREFAKAVVKGLQCQLLTSTEGAPLDCTYQFDKALRLFSVKPVSDALHQLELASVVEVKKDVLGTPFSKLLELQPPHAVSGEQLERRVACVIYCDGEKAQQTLVLLMPNQFERERFYTCMNILRWALTTRQQKNGELGAQK